MDGILIRLLTVSVTHTLTSSREINCFSNCHFTNMQVMLAYVSRCFLRNKLLESMPVVSNLSLHLIIKACLSKYLVLLMKHYIAYLHNAKQG